MALPRINDEHLEQAGVLHELLQGNFCPPPPELLIQLQKAEGDIQTITKLIIKNPSVMVSILKIVNSSAFNLSKKITEIEKAIVLLGADSVIRIVSAVLLRASFEETSSEMLGIWNSSEEVALACSILSKQLNVWNRDRCYILGLFHNCGLAVLLKKFPNYLLLIRETYSRDDGLPTKHENQAINTDHAMVSYMMAKNWRLPEEIYRTIKIHHDIDYLANGAGDLTESLYLLKIAEDIGNLHVTLGHKSDNREWALIGDAILSHFAMSDYEYEDLKDLVRNEMACAE